MLVTRLNEAASSLLIKLKRSWGGGAAEENDFTSHIDNGAATEKRNKSKLITM